MAMAAPDRRLTLVLDLARRVTARHELDDVLAETFRSLRAMLPFTGGSIQLLDDDGWIRMAATDPAAPPHVLAMRIPLGSTVGGRIILTEQPVYVPDVAADAAVPADRRQANLSRGVRSYLGVPLVAEGRAIGLIQIDSDQPDTWGEDERVLLSSVAPIVAAAIQNARAHAVQRAALEHLSDAELRMARAREAIAELQTLVTDVLERAPVLPRQGGAGSTPVGRMTIAAADAHRLADAAAAAAQAVAAGSDPTSDADELEDQSQVSTG
jgi:GAF domain-containing protein